jgi:acyl-CoA thioesterase
VRFSEILDSLRSHDSVWTADVSEDWLQGRSVFGGVQAALALRVMRASVPRDVPLRVLQIVFVAPVDAGRITLRTEVLRAGKSVTHVEARILDGGKTAAIAVGLFGRGRRSDVQVTPRPPTYPVQSSVPRTLATTLPAFAQHFTVRWLRGAEPFSGADMPMSLIEADMKDVAHATEEHVVAIADFPPPLAFSFLKTLAPGSSLTWTLEMLGGALENVPLEGWRLHAELIAARDGYTDQSILVCSPDGEPVAISRQSMVVFG